MQTLPMRLQSIRRYSFDPLLDSAAAKSDLHSYIEDSLTLGMTSCIASEQVLAVQNLQDSWTV